MKLQLDIKREIIVRRYCIFHWKRYIASLMSQNAYALSDTIKKIIFSIAKVFCKCPSKYINVVELSDGSMTLYSISEKSHVIKVNLAVHPLSQCERKLACFLNRRILTLLTLLLSLFNLRRETYSTGMDEDGPKHYV